MNTSKKDFYIIANDSNCAICETLKEAIDTAKDKLFKDTVSTIYHKCDFTGKCAEYVCDIHFDENSFKNNFTNKNFTNPLMNINLKHINNKS